MDVAGLGGAVAVGDHVPVRRDPLRRVAPPELVRRLPDVTESGLGQVVLPVVVDGARDVAAAHLGAGLPGILLRGARVHQHRAAAASGAAHLIQRSGVRQEWPVGKCRRGHPRIVDGDRPLLELPFRIAAVEQVHLRVPECREQERGEGRVDVARLAGAIDHHWTGQVDSETREQRAIRPGREQAGRNAAFAGPESLGVQILGAGQMPLEVCEDVGAHVQQQNRALGLPARQLLGRDQLRMRRFRRRRRGRARRGGPSAARGPDHGESRQPSVRAPPHGVESSPSPMYARSSST